MSERPLTTGEHRAGNATTEQLLARIDALEHALSLKEGGYSPHVIAVENHQLLKDNQQAVELLERCIHSNSIEEKMQANREAAQWLQRYKGGE